ncbi:MAG TPA: DNA-binding protein, partial [Mycobacterium sp.]|nr:DNA-binding protein [Mycobacterium sp.]
IPMWQVNAGAERGFLPGIADLRRVFPGGVVSLSRWAVTPNVDLGDMTPADALAAGRVQDVIAAATKTTTAAW